MNLLDSKAGRLTVATTLYFTEGAPIGFIWWALPTILRKQGLEIDLITSLTAVLILPWIFKFLWAPLIDSVRNEKRGYKFWILLSQTTMGIFLLPLVFIEPQNNFLIWGAILLLHSIAAATQDVSIDALIINIIAKNERGKINGFMNAGMLLGRSVFGGGTLLLASSIGLKSVIVLLIITILLTIFMLFFIKEPQTISRAGNQFKMFKENFLISFGDIRTWAAILFALTAAASFESAGALAGPFLTDINIKSESIGLFFALPVVAAMLVGGLVGGYFSDETGRKKTVTISILGFVICVLLIAMNNFIGGTESILYFVLFSIMYFFVGLFTASSYALFMDLTNPKIGATQFSTYMAATNGCEAWAIWLAGTITVGYGYSHAFVVVSIISLLSILLLRMLKK